MYSEVYNSSRALSVRRANVDRSLALVETLYGTSFDIERRKEAVALTKAIPR